AKMNNADNVFVHAFTDGRDVDPKSGADHINHLVKFMTENEIGQLASVVGRYYAMDRDKRWERVKKAYDLLVKGIGMPSQNAVLSIADNYANGITDEFLEPIVMVNENNQPVSVICPDDVVVFFNFRTDRGRQ